MASYLGIPPGPGMMEVADGEALPTAAVRNSKIDGLYALTAGECRAPIAGDLAAQALQSLIATISESMRFSIIGIEMPTKSSTIAAMPTHDHR